MSHDPSEATPLESPHRTLERALIDEFVRAAGHDPSRLNELPDAVRERLLTEASVYASVRLSEVESRSHYVQELHEARPGRTQTGLD
jgi:hypothetical protein